jgi:hypothetical protein
MSQDIFGREVAYGGGFEPEGTTVKFAGIVSGALVRNLNVSYQQQISRVWDLGSGRAFFIAGHTAGQFSIGRIAGPGASASALASYSVCAPGTMTFTGENGLCLTGGTNSPVNYTMHNVITTSLGLAITSDDMVINESVAGTFLHLSTKD